MGTTSRDRYLLTNATIVTAARIIEGGTVVVEGGTIVEVAERGYAADAGTIDLGGRMLLPGLVDLHNDALEQEISPRPRAEFDPRFALLHLDRKLAAAGVTTEFHAVYFGERDSGRSLTVATRLDPRDRMIRVTVTDNGPGVPSAIRSRIFEPFFTTKPVGMGTGIGLSVCHGVVTAHGGTIAVDDAPGGGAVFEIRLPATATVEVAAGPGPVSGATAAGGRVLVVDDEPAVAESLADILRLAGVLRDTDSVTPLLESHVEDVPEARIVVDYQNARAGSSHAGVVVLRKLLRGFGIASEGPRRPQLKA